MVVLSFFWGPKFHWKILLQAAEVQAFIKGSEARIAKLTEELGHWEAMIPYDQMTMEEWAEAFPEQVRQSCFAAGWLLYPVHFIYELFQFALYKF